MLGDQGARRVFEPFRGDVMLDRADPADPAHPLEEMGKESGPLQYRLRNDQRSFRPDRPADFVEGSEGAAHLILSGPPTPQEQDDAGLANSVRIHDGSIAGDHPNLLKVRDSRADRRDAHAHAVGELAVGKAGVPLQCTKNFDVRPVEVHPTTMLLLLIRLYRCKAIVE